MTDLSLDDRALAAFLGFAAGDALGATVEFMTRGEIAARHGLHREIIGGGWLRLAPGAVTDDTEMALALGRSLVRRGGLDVRDVCEEFAKWLKSRPVDVGNTCRRGIRRYVTQGTIEGPFYEGDAGNGAAMRILPLALATLGDPDKAVAWTQAQSRITHNHPLSDAAALTLVRILHGVLSGGGKQAARDIAEALIGQYPVFRFAPYRGQSSAYVVDTMHTVLHFYFTTESFPIASSRRSTRAGTPTPPEHWRRCSLAPPMAWPRCRKSGSASSTGRWPPKSASKCRICSLFPRGLRRPAVTLLQFRAEDSGNRQQAEVFRRCFGRPLRIVPNRTRNVGMPTFHRSRFKSVFALLPIRRLGERKNQLCRLARIVQIPRCREVPTIRDGNGAGPP